MLHPHNIATRGAGEKTRKIGPRGPMKSQSIRARHMRARPIRALPIRIRPIRAQGGPTRARPMRTQGPTRAWPMRAQGGP